MRISAFTDFKQWTCLPDSRPGGGAWSAAQRTSAHGARARSSCGSAFVLATIFVPAAVFVPNARSLSAMQLLCAQPRPAESDFLLGGVRWRRHFLSPNPR